MPITKRIPKLVSDWRLGSAGFAYNTILQVGEVSGVAEIQEGANAWSPTIERYLLTDREPYNRYWTFR